MRSDSQNKKRFDLELFTIGHSNHTLQKLVELLAEHGIDCLVDVRSTPYSSFNPDFSREHLARGMEERGVRYLWMGDKLGGRRVGITNAVGQRLDDEYHVDARYREGLVELMRTALRSRCAIMCSEEDPRRCHRHKIIADSLLGKRIPECDKLDSIKVLHIRGDGEVEDASRINVGVQTALKLK